MCLNFKNAIAVVRWRRPISDYYGSCWVRIFFFCPRGKIAVCHHVLKLWSQLFDQLGFKNGHEKTIKIAECTLGYNFYNLSKIWVPSVLTYLFVIKSYPIYFSSKTFFKNGVKNYYSKVWIWSFSKFLCVHECIFRKFLWDS